jgi:hypothetical protein
LAATAASLLPSDDIAIQDQDAEGAALRVQVAPPSAEI